MQPWVSSIINAFFLTCTALLRFLSGHLHESIQYQSIIQPCVPVLQLLQEVSTCGFRYLSSGQFTKPLNESWDAQQGYCWKKKKGLLVQFNDISCYKCQKQGKQTQSNALLLLYKINDTANKSLNSEDNLPWLTSAREGLALRFCCAFLANRVCLSSFPTSGSEIVTERMRQKLASCCWSKLWTRPDRLGMPSNWIISWKVWPDVKHQMWTECRHCNTFKSNFWDRPRLNLIWPSRYMYKCYMPVYA